MSRRLVLALASCAAIFAAVVAPQPAAASHCLQYGICYRDDMCCSNDCVFNMAAGAAFCTPSNEP